MSDLNFNTHSSSCCPLRPHNVDKLSIFFGELAATCMLIFLGCMGCVENSVFANSHFQNALNFGLVVLICIQSFGCVSGAHLNPAVTLAAYVYNIVTLPMAVVYFIAQMLGAFIGYGLLLVALPSDAITSPDTPNGVCVTALHSNIGVARGVFIEFLITCVLIAVCCSVWDPRNSKLQDSVPLRFGLIISCLSLTAAPFTGGSMNPARSFGPAVWNQSWEHHWIYWVAPLTAALVTSLIYKYAFRREAQIVQGSPAINPAAAAEVVQP